MMVRFTLLVLIALHSVWADAKGDLNALADKLENALPAGKPTLAVIPLETNNTKQGEEARAISEWLAARFSGSDRATLVERAQFHNAMSELALSQSGAMDENQVLEVGKAVSAKYLLVGSIGDMMGKRRVTLRLLETETATVLQGGSFEAGAADLSQLPKELFGESGQMSASLYRSAIAPGWGQFYTGHPVRGSIALLAFLGSATYMGLSFAEVSAKDSDLSDFRAKSLTNSGDDALKQEFSTESGLVEGAVGFQQAFNDWKASEEAAIRQDKDDAQSQAMLGVGLTVGAWALNMVDAALCGASQKKKMDMYFSAMPTGGVLQVALHW